MNKYINTLLIVILLIFFTDCAVSAKSIQYHRGPENIVLEGNIGYLYLPEGFVYIGGEDLKKIIAEHKEIPSDHNIGAVFDESGKWECYLIYVETGYIRDSDVDKIDPDQVLSFIKSIADEDNQQRRRVGASTISVIGWDKKPVYDKINHRLALAFINMDNGIKFLNAKNYILGRQGVLSCSIVTDLDNSSLAYDNLEKIIASIKFTEGKEYGSFISGDKVSNLTLSEISMGKLDGYEVKAEETNNQYEETSILYRVLLGLVVLAVGIPLIMRWNKAKKMSNDKDHMIP